jgi:hypothetical protein
MFGVREGFVAEPLCHRVLQPVGTKLMNYEIKGRHLLAMEWRLLCHTLTTKLPRRYKAWLRMINLKSMS